MLKRLTIMSLAAVAMALPVQAQELGSMPWDQIIAQAKKEGEITWFQWYFQDRFREQVEAFEAETGIKVKIPDGSHDANFNKMLAEKDRSEGDIDVLSMTGADLKKIDVTKSFSGPIRDILPGGASLRYEIEGNDSKGYAPTFWGNQLCIAYDPSRIKESELPRTLEQFEQFMKNRPGELGFNATSGSGAGFIEAVVRKLVPDVDYAAGKSDEATLAKLAPAWKWFNDHQDGFIISASNADSVTRLTSGEFTLVATSEDLLSGLQKKGEVPKTYKIYVPDFGMPSGGNVVTIPANAKHKAAALVFINWLTSAETQSQLSREFGSVPEHPDADKSASLISDADRKKGFTRVAKPLGDEIPKQFAKNVLQK